MIEWEDETDRARGTPRWESATEVILLGAVITIAVVTGAAMAILALWRRGGMP